MIPLLSRMKGVLGCCLFGVAFGLILFFGLVAEEEVEVEKQSSWMEYIQDDCSAHDQIALRVLFGE